MDSIFFYRNTGKAASSKGALQKMKIALQPNISVTGWPTEAGSKALAGFHALENAAVVDKMAGEGAEFAGYARMSEFGFGLKDSMAGMPRCKKTRRMPSWFWIWRVRRVWLPRAREFADLNQATGWFRASAWPV